MIGAGTTIRGNLTGQEDLVVGKIEGSVRLTSDLTVDALRSWRLRLRHIT